MRIYLDHNATTPLRDEVVDAMLPVLREGYGNPSSTHAEGSAARRRVERAREQVAAALGVSPEEVVFTAGATEANNIVLRGIAATSDGPARVVTTRVEHPSVLEPCQQLEEAGQLLVERLPVDAEGLVAPEVFAAAVGRAGTRLASVIWANNETGVLQPAAALAGIAGEHTVPMHFDATQVVGKLPIDAGALPFDFLSCSAHKLNGPKGVGALVVRNGRSLPALLAGGPQERGRRGGTENVASIVGFGVACELARREAVVRRERHAELRDRLWEGMRAKIPGLRRNGSAEHVLPNTLNVEIAGVPGEVLLQALDLEGLAASAGAACHSGSITPSHVLSAMGRQPEEARCSIRLSVGHGVDEAQIDQAIALLAQLSARIRRSGAA